MKQYVLDEPVAAAPPSAEPQALPLTQPGWWRWLVLAILLEAVALALLYVALSGFPGSSPDAPSRGVAYVASFSFPREAQAVQGPAQAAEAPVSRIRQERGRYVVDLHDEAPAAALAMLAEATKAHVAGSGIFSGSALRLTRSVVATSPREAWQAVFGDIANFAIACAGSACEVRFVSLAKPGAPVPRPEALQAELSDTEPPAIAPTSARPGPVPISHAAASAKAAADGDETPSSDN
jgi:hypothetical protein